MRKVLFVVAVIFTLEILILTGISFYDLSLFREIRVCLITKAVTGLEIIIPVISSVIDAFVETK